jgi:cephalosporin-C deacetylase
MKATLLIQIILAVTSAAAFADYSLDVHLDKRDGFYKVGEETVCTFTLMNDGKPAAGEKVRCTVKREREVYQQEEFISDGKAQKITAAMDRPGWLFFGFEIIGPDGQPRQGKGIYKHSRKPTIVGEIGAMFDVQEIKALNSRPADFDAYWASCRAKLNEVPLSPKLEALKVPLALQGKIECYGVEVGCLGRNPVRGYLAMPVGAKPGSLVAYVNYQSRVSQDASQSRAMEMASNGVLALFVSWHGLPPGSSEDSFQKMAGSWDDEGGKARDKNPDTWHGHDMYLRAMRALDFIKSHPQWNRKDLIVSGGSLGGIQTIAAAALDPDVTMAVVSVPSGCEYNGYKQGRDAAGQYRGKLGIAHLESDPRHAETLAYHDGVNFAPLIQSEIYVCTGFTDESCTPSSVYAFYNALPANSKKFLSTNPSTGHFGTTKNTAGNERLADMFRSVTVD